MPQHFFDEDHDLLWHDKPTEWDEISIRIKKTIERYGFRFAKATVKMVDHLQEKELDVILLLDTLTSESPAITYEQYQQLYKEVGLDYKGQKEINKKLSSYY